MTHILRFELVLGWLAVLKISAILRVVFRVFLDRKKNNIRTSLQVK